MSIALHIERLVIDEALLWGERADRVRAMVESELAQQLAHPGALERLRGLGALDSLPAATLLPAAHPRGQLGTRIAAAVGQGLRLPDASHGMSETRHG